jgi:protocatechuate 3,4-dioxygenase beta subunit
MGILGFAWSRINLNILLLEVYIMENDDELVGGVLSRRDALKVLGLGGAALLAACTPPLSQTGQPTNAAPLINSTASTKAITSAVPSCVVRPAMTEGPYFVDEMLNRSDIRSDPTDGSIKAGLPLALKFNVSQVGNNVCSPLSDAQVDVWHCDALGVYSDAQDPGFNTQGRKFLRGYQVTDTNGLAQFRTIYPGWYSGRTVHIHFKIRFNAYEFTSQLFFDDSLSDQVFAQMPYSQKGQRNIRNADDGIYQNGGSQLLLNAAGDKNGYSSVFNIGLQL